MIGRRRTWGIGWIAACAAAYALVFQIVLTSALMASASAAGPDAGTLFCHSDASSDTQAEGGGKTSKSVHHCPLCLSRMDVAVLPPELTAVIDRVAIELHFRAVLRSSLQGQSFALPFQPRAPPARA